MVLLDESMVVTYQRRVDRLQERIADLNKELAQHVKAFFELQGQLHIARYNSLHFKSDNYAEEVLVLDWALRWEKGQRDETRRKIEMNEWLMEEPTRELALVKHMIQTKPVLISDDTDSGSSTMETTGGDTEEDTEEEGAEEQMAQEKEETEWEGIMEE
ncbi:hypothetical protein P167DRAFT_580042 [Morchella conica CCBAS932]|uniref:Uncharacterized protein n=1 Tax=Morchella conica CCBAS932 TaxID=1392247 RepID=A0A3N4K8C9_9PEZI|nr:hypothetical protein P167DRAFT_580042 [Morchella conica CCBAS932]